MNNYSVYNDPKMYRHNCAERENLTVALKPVFALREEEKINHTFTGYCNSSLEDIQAMLDDTDVAIIEEVARSKFLTSLHVYEYLGLRGIDVKRPRLRKRILKLMKLRLIQENEIVIPEAVHGVKYYELDIMGYFLAKEQGVIFNRGNMYLSYKKKEELNAFDTPQDVKRILVGNQIILGLLLSNAKMERFGIMETFRIETESENLDGCILRTAAMARIDSESVLAFEVVRDSVEAYDKLADKIERYYKMAHSKKYLEANHHGDDAVPQIVICGESLEHNRKIAEYLRKKGLWDAEDVVLFTEDLLNMKDSLKSIYEITDNDEIRWYRLPEETRRQHSSDRCSA